MDEIGIGVRAKPRVSLDRKGGYLYIYGEFINAYKIGPLLLKRCTHLSPPRMDRVKDP